MILFGCTRAPYYSPDPRCTDRRGFHHGIDVAMRCGPGYGPPRAGWSERPLGPAYGANPLLLRNLRIGYDVVIAHTRRVFVHEGDRVRQGHADREGVGRRSPRRRHPMERRALGGGLATASRPRQLLALTPKE